MSERRLVLVGGGHARVEVLRRWASAPVRGVRVTVVVDRPDAVYSGMVPGLVAGDYVPEDVSIDVVALARRAGARVELSAATKVEPDARRIRVRSGAALAYDVASLDVGSSVRGLDLPGVREYSLPTRPIADEGCPWVRKAGVYAVRAGPVLDANLRARLEDGPLRFYRPQRDFLTLVNLGGRRAIGTKWGMVAGGRWVWRLKDRIDRRFVERFRVATPAGDDAVLQVRSPSR